MTDASVSKTLPALIGGLVLGVLSAIPTVQDLNCVCCLWVVGGGVLASYFYLKECTSRVGYGDGAVLGLLTGLFGAVVSTIVSLPLTLLGLGYDPAEVEEALERMREADVPPEFIDFVEMMASPDGVWVALLVGIGFSLVLFPLFAMLGSIIGTALFQKNKGSAPPPPSASGDRVSSTPPPPSGGTGGASGSGGAPSSSGGGAAPPPSSPPSGGAAAPGAPSPPPADDSSGDKSDS